MIAGTISESAGPLDGRFLLHTQCLCAKENVYFLKF